MVEYDRWWGGGRVQSVDATVAAAHQALRVVYGLRSVLEAARKDAGGHLVSDCTHRDSCQSCFFAFGVGSNARPEGVYMS